MSRSLALVVLLMGGSALAAPGRGTTIYYHAEQGAQPQVLVESNGAWGKKTRPMRPVRNRPGWWKAHVRGGASSLVFQHADSGEWIHPRDGQNFVNAHGAAEVFVKDHALTYAPPEHARVEQVVAPRQGTAGQQLTVILPPGYDPGASKKYPVAYFLDGHNLLSSEYDPQGWAAHDALTKVVLDGQMEPTILVGIHAPSSHAGRLDEYSPYVVEKAKAGGQANAFVGYLANELIPYVESRYAARTGARNRGIVGSSVGGLGALTARLLRPDLFGRVMPFSPAVWIGGEQIVADVKRATNLGGARVVLYQGSRGAGGMLDEGDKTERLYDALKEKGLVDGRSLFRYVNEGGLHHEKAWREVLPWGLSLLFPAR